MKPTLILLCAGRGKRMENLTEERPKALLYIKDKPIIEHTIESFFDNYPDSDIILLSGYKKCKLREWIKQYSFSIQEVYNNLWSDYGPIISADIALRRAQEKKFIILGNGDTLFSNELFSRVAERIYDPGLYLVGSKVQMSNPDDMLINIQDNNVLHAIKRKTGIITSEYESAGLLIAIGHKYVSALEKIFRGMAEDIIEGKSSDGPWHRIIRELVLCNYKISFIEVPEKSWWEFDTQKCIVNAEINIK